MGTTLTGTKPKDTYDSLIKVEDNGPISGTAKYLSDGLGNNLPIAVSTTNVGIGTTAPEARLDARLTTNTNSIQKISRLAANNASGELKAFDVSYTGSANVMTIGTAAVGTDPSISVNVGAAEIVRFISGGLTFNGDTAAANALDDYEEGTFTPTLAFGGTGISVYNTRKGFYTKIGNTVNFTIFIQVQQKGAGTGAVTVSLPLASVNTQDRSYSINVTGQSLSGLSGALFGYLVENSSSVQVFQTDATGGTALTDAVFNDFSTDNIIVTGTYQA